MLFMMFMSTDTFWRKMLSDFPFDSGLEAINTEIYSRTFLPLLANRLTVLQLNMKKNNFHISKRSLQPVCSKLSFCFVLLDIVPTRANQ